MWTVNYAEFRKRLKANIAIVCDNREVMIVSGAHDKNVVVVSLDEYNSMQESLYLLSTASNQQRLAER